MEKLRFECMGPKCPKTCCTGLDLITYEAAGLKFSMPAAGTLKDGKLHPGKIPNRILLVTETQKNPGEYYPPLFVAKTRHGISYYGSQMFWRNGVCTKFKNGLCTDYDNRPWECRAAPFMLEGENLVAMQGCPAMKKATPDTTVLTSDESWRAAKIIQLINEMLFKVLTRDGIQEIYFVHPETTKLPGFEPDNILTIDVRNNKITIDRKENNTFSN